MTLRKYDVAISLLAQDQDYATDLEQEIRKVVRGDVFLYSRRQGELAADGALVEKFTRTFRDEARVVVILYRPRWGTTPYTSIEQDAILARRALETSSRFMVMVSLEGFQTPSWYPGSSEFVLTPDAFSPSAIAGVVAARVHEAGGVTGSETVAERMQRLQRSEAAAQELENRKWTEGHQQLRVMPQEFFDLLKVEAEHATAASAEPMRIGQRHDIHVVSYRWAHLIAEWQKPMMNPVEESRLSLTIQNQNPLARGSLDPGVLPPLKRSLHTDFRIALNPGGWGWAPMKKPPALHDRTFFTTAELVAWVLGELAEHGHREPPRPSRKSVNRRPF